MIWVSECDVPGVQAAQRGAPGEQREQQPPAAARRSGRACRWCASLARAVKKSTMMLPRRTWHSGMNSAMAAPAATPVSSKAPTMECAGGVAADQAAAGHQRDAGQQHAGQDGAELGQVFQDAQARSPLVVDGRARGGRHACPRLSGRRRGRRRASGRSAPQCAEAAPRRPPACRPPPPPPRLRACRCRSGRRAAAPRPPTGARWSRRCSRSAWTRCCAGGPGR